MKISLYFQFLEKGSTERNFFCQRETDFNYDNMIPHNHGLKLFMKNIFVITNAILCCSSDTPSYLHFQEFVLLKRNGRRRLV